MLKNKVDIVVDPKARKIDELYVRPVNFRLGVEKFLNDWRARYPRADLLER